MMKKSLWLLLLLFAYLPCAVAIDYDNDGVNDDPYRPGFIRYNTQSLYFFIDLTQSQNFYTLEFDNDSDTTYTFTTGDGFTVHNDNDGILRPLEQASFKVTIYPDRLTDGMRQDIASGALQLEALDQPAGAIVSASPITIYDDSTMPFNVTVANVTPEMASLPVQFNLFNTSSGQNIVIDSGETGQYLTTDDRPFGHITSLDAYDTLPGLTIVSGSQLTVSGWAFDDNDGMTLTLYYKRPADPTDTPVQTTVSRSVHPINTEIPYWGDTYPSGFAIEWDNDAHRGYYDVRVVLNDGSHEVSLPTQNIYWNKPPDGELYQPVPDEDITAGSIVVSGAAYDMDVDLGISAYLSSVEVYVDSPSHMIRRIPNPDFDNDTLLFNFTWDTVYDFSQGQHTLFAIAYDSFGLSQQFGTRTITIFKTAPEILSVFPRLGPWKGNTVVSITGSNLDTVNSVQFGSETASIIPGSQTAGLMQVQISAIAPPQSRYVDVSLTNSSASAVRQDGYRFLPAELGVGPITDTIADILYNNLKSQLYLLNVTQNRVDVYAPDPSDALAYAKSSDFALNASAVPLAMDIAKYQTAGYVIYENRSFVDFYDFTSTPVLADTIPLTDNEGDPVDTVSLATLMYDVLLVGTQGLNASLLMVEVEPSQLNHSITTLGLGASYNRIEIFSSSNKAVAYIVAKDTTANTFDVFRFDARSMLLTQVPMTLALDPGQVGEVKIAPNYNGTQSIIYTTDAVALYDSQGSLLDTGFYGADHIIFDNTRAMFYTFNNGDSSFTLRTPTNLDEEITFSYFPQSATAYGDLELSWSGETLFAVTPQGIAAVKIGDIYPQVSVTPTFVTSQDTLQVVAQNAGNIPENIDLFVNDTLQSSQVLTQSDNDTHTFSMPVPLSDDTSGSLFARLNGYPSKEEDLYLMSNLFDKVADMSGLATFKPAGLFYDDLRSDLYVFDASKSSGVSVARFHITFDVNGTVAATRMPVPAAMQIAYPIGMSATNDYILAVSRLTKHCYWFDVDTFDATGSADVYSATVSPYISLSGVTGYSPRVDIGVNYAYVWNQLSTGGPDVYQIDLDTRTVTRCNFISPRTSDIIIDYTDNPLNDRAYAVSSTVYNTNSDFVTIFEPGLPASSISAVSTIDLPVNAGGYQLAVNDEAVFATLRTLKGISLIMPDLSGSENHGQMPIISNHSKSPQFFSVNNEYLVFNGRESNNTYALSFIDVNIWNDYPADIPFDMIGTFNTGGARTYDVEIIFDKLFTVIGEEIYIIDLPQKEDE